MQQGAGGDHTGREIAPEYHHQLARQDDDGNAPDASFEIAHSLAEPARQRAVRLMDRPEPCQFDGELTGPPVAGFADALLPASLAAVVRRAGEAKVTADLTAVVEVAIEHLVDQFLAADRADAFEVNELHDPGFRRASLRGAQFGPALASSSAICRATSRSRSCSRAISSFRRMGSR